MASITGYGSQATTSTVDSVLKEIYRDPNFADACYRNRPALGMVDKFERFGGRDYRVPVLYSRPQGAGAQFYYASYNATPSAMQGFVVTRQTYYATFSITGETIEADASVDEYTFASWMKTEADQAMNTWSDQMSGLIFGSGTGSIGQISSGSVVTTNTITLANINQITLFEVGMTLQANATDGGATPRAGQEVIAAVNRTLGQLTSTSAAWDDVITTIAAGDYLLVQGNVNACISGFSGWNPPSDPVFGTDDWYTVDRGSDPTRLAGVRYNGASLGASIEEILLDSLALAYREGAMIDTMIMSMYDLAQLQKTQQSRVVLVRDPLDVKAKNGQGDIATIGFSSYVLDCAGGRVRIVADPKCPQGQAYGWGEGSYQLASVGKAPKWLEADGLWIRAIPQYDAYQGRIGFYGNLISRRTLNMLNVTFPAGNALP